MQWSLTYCNKICSRGWKKLSIIEAVKEIKVTRDLIHILSCQHVRLCIYVTKWYLWDVPVMRWCTKREWASNPFSISWCQRWSSVNGAFTSCCRDSSWGTISSSSASSFSLPYFWISQATPCNSASLRSPFCAKCYRKWNVWCCHCWMSLDDNVCWNWNTIRSK